MIRECAPFTLIGVLTKEFLIFPKEDSITPSRDTSLLGCVIGIRSKIVSIGWLKGNLSFIDVRR
jgi:hypothetical protein